MDLFRTCGGHVVLKPRELDLEKARPVTLARLEEVATVARSLTVCEQRFRRGKSPGKRSIKRRPIRGSGIVTANISIWPWERKNIFQN